MKKLLVISLWLLVTFWLVGCGNKDTLVQLDQLQLELSWLQSELNVQVEKNLTLVTELQDKALPVIELWIGLETILEEVVIEPKETFLQLAADQSKFPVQPQHIKGNDYTANTSHLREFALSHMFNVDIPIDATEMTVKLKYPVDDPKGFHNVIVYVYAPSGRHCGGRVIRYVDSDTFTYNLKDMNIQTPACRTDYTKYINWKTVKVWGYVSSYDGNKIESITFK